MDIEDFKYGVRECIKANMQDIPGYGELEQHFIQQNPKYDEVKWNSYLESSAPHEYEDIFQELITTAQKQIMEVIFD